MTPDTTSDDPRLVMVTHRPVYLGDALRAPATHEPSRAKSVPFLSDRDRKRFEAKFLKAGNDECWLWAAGTNDSGYGVFTIGKRQYRAHRVAVRNAGYGVPTKAVIDHICRNRLCVNPRHLRTVDRFTNVHENSDALAHKNSLKTHCPQGHPYSGDNLVIRKSGRRRCKQCAADYHRRRRSGISALRVGIGIAITYALLWGACAVLP